MRPFPNGRGQEREFFIDNLLVRIHFIIVMTRWTGLAPGEFEFSFPGSLTSTFLGQGARKHAKELPAGDAAAALQEAIATLKVLLSLLYYSQA